MSYELKKLSPYVSSLYYHHNNSKINISKTSSPKSDLTTSVPLLVEAGFCSKKKVLDRKVVKVGKHYCYKYRMNKALGRKFNTDCIKLAY